MRVCDVGGWTDTWFAGHGAVCSLAVGPAVTVEAWTDPGGGSVRVEAPDVGAAFIVGAEPEAHSLLAEAVREAGGAPSGHDLTVRIRSRVPPGASLGTSAAVCVGVISAVEQCRGVVQGSGDLAAAAHRTESERVGRQSGVQDQAAVAHGGANFIEVDQYPAFQTSPVHLHPTVRAALDGRLVHVTYGAGHDSSAVHEAVIADLRDDGPGSRRLERLRRLAERARQALAHADLDLYGRVLRAATDAQAALHPSLVSTTAHALIEASADLGAVGWKVNGAGGAGGSLSVLCRAPSDVERITDLARTLGHQVLDLRIAARRRI